MHMVYMQMMAWMPTSLPDNAAWIWCKIIQIYDLAKISGKMWRPQIILSPSFWDWSVSITKSLWKPKSADSFWQGPACG